MRSEGPADSLRIERDQLLRSMSDQWEIVGGPRAEPVTAGGLAAHAGGIGGTEGLTLRRLTAPLRSRLCVGADAVSALMVTAPTRNQRRNRAATVRERFLICRDGSW